MCWLNGNAFQKAFCEFANASKKCWCWKQSEKTTTFFVPLKACIYICWMVFFCNATDNVNHTFDVFISAKMEWKWWKIETITRTLAHTKKQPFHANIIILMQCQCRQWWYLSDLRLYITQFMVCYLFLDAGNLFHHRSFRSNKERMTW